MRKFNGGSHEGPKNVKKGLDCVQSNNPTEYTYFQKENGH